MTKTTTRVLAGVAVAALAAAGAAAVMHYRQGQKPHPDVDAHLDELEVRLHEVEEPDKTVPPSRVGRVRHGTLSPEQAAVAESDFETLEREADQGGA